MGGIGSGTWYRWNSKDTTDEHRDFDIRVLRKRGGLTPGCQGSYSWTRGGEPSGSIEFRTLHSKVVLSYRCRVHGEGWESIEHTVGLTYTPCNYGGQRAWFICPAYGCGRRVAVLYGAGRYFACRHCYELAYQSQREQWLERTSRKSRKIIKRLGGDPYDDVYPDRPRGMHWKTYNQLIQKAVNFDEVYDCFLGLLLSRKAQL